MNLRKSKVAIFDVDMTIFNGDLGIEFVKVLLNDGVFSAEIGKDIFNWYQKYKSGEIEKSIAIDMGYDYYNKGLMGNNSDIILEKSLKTWDNVKSKVYPYIQPLIDFLILNEFEIVLLSGSPIEMVSHIGQDLGVKSSNIIAGLSEKVNEVYTGKAISTPSSSDDKVNEMYKWALEHGIDILWEQSCGYGDDERDLGILSIVGNPFVINPSESFKLDAQNRGFTIATPESILELSKEKLTSFVV